MTDLSGAAGSRATVVSGQVSGLAVASLVIGLVGLLSPCGVPGGLTAICLGAVARSKIEDSRGQLAGKGLATAGIVLGIIASGLWTAICAAAP